VTQNNYRLLVVLCHYNSHLRDYKVYDQNHAALFLHKCMLLIDYKHVRLSRGN